MTSKVTYKPFISKPIPESSARSPIPISFPISEYRGADPDREVIPVQYTPPKTESEVETTTEAPTEHTHNYSRNLTTIPNCTTASVTIYYSMIDSTK